VASVFFSYSHADEGLRDQLEKQLSLLKRQGIIEVWHDRRIGAGREFGKEIDWHVETDDIILLLVSSDFLDSDYCYEKEMARAMERHEAGEAIVIPVILRACDWHGAPFGKINATPPDGRPVTQFPDRDQALLEVAKAVRQAAERLGSKVGQRQAPRAKLAFPAVQLAERPRYRRGEVAVDAEIVPLEHVADRAGDNRFAIFGARCCGKLSYCHVPHRFEDRVAPYSKWRTAVRGSVIYFAMRRRTQ
jgi:hypothetical protein